MPNEPSGGRRPIGVMAALVFVLGAISWAGFMALCISERLFDVITAILGGITKVASWVWSEVYTALSIVWTVLLSILEFGAAVSILIVCLMAVAFVVAVFRALPDLFSAYAEGRRQRNRSTFEMQVEQNEARAWVQAGAPSPLTPERRAEMEARVAGLRRDVDRLTETRIRASARVDDLRVALALAKPQEPEAPEAPPKLPERKHIRRMSI